MGDYEFEMPDFLERNEAREGLLLEVTLCRNGKWRVHKTDLDEKFPSDFHAHRVDEPETLDLYTGMIYSARTNELLRRIPNKVLVSILGLGARSKDPEISERFSSVLEIITKG